MLLLSTGMRNAVPATAERSLAVPTAGWCSVGWEGSSPSPCGARGSRGSPRGSPQLGFLRAPPGEHAAPNTSFWPRPTTRSQLHPGATQDTPAPQEVGAGWGRLSHRGAWAEALPRPPERQGRTRCRCHPTALGAAAFCDSAVFIPARGPAQRGFPWKTSIQNKERRSYSGSDSATTGSFCG